MLEAGDDPKPVEVERDHITEFYADTCQVSPLLEHREHDTDNFCHFGSSAIAGQPPIVLLKSPITPNMVYSIPPPPSNVFFSREVIEKAKTLNLHPDQEHMRYAVAQSLTRGERKHTSSKGVFAKLKKLGSSRR